MKELLRIVIPNYITHVKLCNSRPSKFYTRNIRLPEKYNNEEYSFSAYGILTENASGKAVLANPKTAGTPRYKKINGQEIYNGKLSPVERSLMIKEMKAFYRKYLPKIQKIKKECKIRLEIHNELGDGNQDLDNMSWIMIKVIQDALVESKILPEDNLKVIKGYEVNFYPTQESQERKLVISILDLSQQNRESEISKASFNRINMELTDHGLL